MRAQHRSTPEGRVALAELCQRYWYPLFAYVRYMGHDLHRAQDLTQGFFEQLLEKNYVGDADPAKGKFRTFLLTSLKHFMANEHDKQTAQKRGGSRTHYSLEFEDAERKFAVEPTSNESPEIRFEQQWARSLLDQVIEQLRESYTRAGKQAIFDELKSCLMAEESVNISESATRLGISEGAVRVTIHRLRKQYRDHLKAEIAATIGNPDEVEQEIATLLAAFSRKASSFGKNL